MFGGDFDIKSAIGEVGRLPANDYYKYMKHNLSPNNTVIGSDHPATPIVSLGGTVYAVTRSPVR